MSKDAKSDRNQDRISPDFFKKSEQKETLKKLAIKGQNPSAIVVTCADSRVAPEIIFNAKIGELFVIRVAGNVIGDYELASIEYAALSLKVPVCYIIGHTGCGAVSATIQSYQNKTNPGTNALTKLVEAIKPAVISTIDKNKNISATELVSKTTIENVLQMVGKVSNSPELAEKITTSDFEVKGALFDIHSANLTML